MQLERLVCSACKGNLEWNANNKVFICSSCGSVYRRVDELEFDKSEKEFEKKRLEIELQRKQKEIELKKHEAETKEEQDKRGMRALLAVFFVFAALVFLMVLKS